MVYYPKSQIKTDLYTQGGEFQLKTTKREYIGYYWKNSSGEFYTEKNPSMGGEELERIPVIPPISTNKVIYTKGNEMYNTLKQVNISDSFLVPSYVKPSPTDDDYNIGNFVRYFAKKSNENYYIETSKDIFNELKNKNKSYDYSSYLIFTLTWTLVGDPIKVETTNYNILVLTEQNYNITGLKKYLKFNYLEFYK